MHLRCILSCSSVALLLASSAVAQQPTAEPEQAEPEQVEPAPVVSQQWDEAEVDDPAAPAEWNVSVFDATDTKRVAGSAHKVDAKELERFEDDNIHRTLTRVPGVYVRGEDGYGLRPNIGLRGASSDRSKKVALMEDGVLFAPAPYAAPAAYYFPMVTRMTAVEVFKGPSSLRYGPNTIGGAINLTTRPIPWGHKFGADLAFGSELYGKAHGYYGFGADHWGMLVEGVRIRSDGFKTLDGPRGGDTGFDKMELMAKARVNTDPGAEMYNEASIKVGYAREVSNETYLGLTDQDFRESPMRRYAASALDNMQWDRVQVELSHALSISDEVRLYSTAYRHDLHRDWFKLNRFDGQVRLEDVLSDSTQARLQEILTGAPSTSSDPALLIGNNDRSFVAMGLQSSLTLKIPRLWRIEQRVQLGARVHHDQVDRLHTEDSFIMRGGAPVTDGGATRLLLDNQASALALSSYIIDEISIWRFMLTPGIRMEYVATDWEDSTGVRVEGQQRALLPGIGLLFQAADELSFLGGVHQGFSPVAPGQDAAVQPEEAVNYEAGARLNAEQLGVEVVGFYSDYNNLTPDCTLGQSCTPEDLGTQFNAGEAVIYGLETMAHADIHTPMDLRVPLKLTYTLTQTELLNPFTSENPAFGDVEPGDEIPYVPTHQLSVSAGLESETWGGLVVGATFMDEMREVAGQGPAAPTELTDAHVVFDLGASLKLTDELQLYGKIENLLNNQYLASRRPFGARPGRPRFVYAGVKVNIDRP